MQRHLLPHGKQQSKTACRTATLTDVLDSLQVVVESLFAVKCIPGLAVAVCAGRVVVNVCSAGVVERSRGALPQTQTYMAVMRRRTANSFWMSSMPTAAA